MRKPLTLLMMLLGGAGLGAGSAFGAGLLMPAQSEAAAEPRPADEGPPAFVPMELLVPLVFDDGQLAGYANLKLQLLVEAEQNESVTARLPLLLNAINLQTYRTPLAGAAGGRLPDLNQLRGLIQRSAERTLGHAVVRQVAIVEARTS